MKEFRLSAFTRFLYYAFAIVLPGLGVAMLISFLQDGDSGPAAFMVLWLVWLLLEARWLLLRMPWSIRIDGHTVHFRARSRIFTTAVTELRTIAGIPLDVNRGFVRVTHRGGRFWMSTGFDGFHELLATLHSMNPYLEIKRV